jgi:hypothetical protein
MSRNGQLLLSAEGVPQFFRRTNHKIKGGAGMNRELQQYRFARIEAQNITTARLEAQFKNGIGGLEEVESNRATHNDGTALHALAPV